MKHHPNADFDEEKNPEHYILEGSIAKHSEESRAVESESSAAPTEELSKSEDDVIILNSPPNEDLDTQPALKKRRI